MKNETHCFYSNIAEIHGIEVAIVHYMMLKWINYAKKTRQNLENQNKKSYFSVYIDETVLHSQLPYISKTKIKEIIKLLVEKNLLVALDSEKNMYSNGEEIEYHEFK